MQQQTQNIKEKIIVGSVKENLSTNGVCEGEEKIKLTKWDALFAGILLVLAFIFIRWVLFAGATGWGVLVCVLGYVSAVLGYALIKKIKPKGLSWYWLGILLLTALPYGLWTPGTMNSWQIFLLLAVAMYWPASLFDGLLAGKTSNLLPFDGMNLLLYIPCKNKDIVKNIILALRGDKNISGKEKNKNRNRKAWAIVGGIAVCVPVLAVVLPQLYGADNGGFKEAVDSIASLIEKLWNNFAKSINWVTWIEILLAIPVAYYLCSYLIGLGHKRKTKTISISKVANTIATYRKAPLTSIAIVLGVVCAVYMLFITTQWTYYYSAFAGILPTEYTVYSAYAREGFFEVCRIVAINLGLLLIANITARKARQESRLLKVLNIAIALLTIFIIVTAFSKMGLYIAAQGFTAKRIMTCVFMLFLTGLCVAVIALQKKQFSIARFGAVWGSSLLCLLCLCNLDTTVARYNRWQYERGQLPIYDAKILAQTGAGGFMDGYEVYEKTREEEIYFCLQKGHEEAKDAKGTSRDCWQYKVIREKATPNE